MSAFFKKPFLISYIIFLVSLASCSPPPGAKNEGNSPDSLESALKTQEVLEKSLEAYGGLEFLEGINNVSFDISGTFNSEINGASPAELYRTLPISRQTFFQIKEGRFFSETRLDDAGNAPSLNGSNSNYVFLISDEAFYLMFPRAGVSTTGFMIPGVQDAARALVPHLQVLDLYNDKKKVTWIGTRTLSGKTYDVISYPEKGKLYFFASETGYLTTIESVSRHFLYGNILARSHYQGYHIEDGLLVPGSYTSFYGDEPRYVFNFQDLNLDAVIDETLFTPPENIQVYENELPENPPRLDQVADHAFLLFGPLNTFFVEFEDYVVVVEAHGRSAEYLPTIREATGNKPIRFVVPTHHHNFHVAGLRTFVQEGIPILTTSRNQPHFERIAKTKFEIDPDPQSVNPKEPIFEIVNDKKVFDDGKTRLEIINIGPIGHADDMFVAWLPNDKLIFSVDVLAHNPHGLPKVTADYYRQQAIDNFNAILDSGIEFETILTGHTKPASFEEMKRVVYGEDSGS